MWVVWVDLQCPHPHGCGVPLVTLTWVNASTAVKGTGYPLLSNTKVAMPSKYIDD